MSTINNEELNFKLPLFFPLATGGKELSEEELPLVSIIIPTYNCAPLISITLEYLLKQQYKNLEILVIDASSTDHTLDRIRNFRSPSIHLYSVKEYQCYVMLNKGIGHAKGKYINCLFPGDYYISRWTLREIMITALENHSPHLVFCGSLLRDETQETKVLCREFTLSALQKGHQPTSLQACWFHAETFLKIGKFTPSYKLRGGFELMCRFIQNESLRVACSKKILVDYDLRRWTGPRVWTHFWETLRIIERHFGFFRGMKWLIFYQEDGKRFLKVWKRRIKGAFIRPH